MLVVDASALAIALVDDGEDGRTVRNQLRGQQLRAPELVDIEILSVLRGRVAGRKLTAHRAASAIEDLAAMGFPRAPHRPLVKRIWELRHNMSAYDAAYVALAEILDAPLLTGDRRLAASTGPRCEFKIADSSDA